MDERIKEMMHKAFTGEAKANLRLKLFAEKAEEEGYGQIAKLFEVIALSESIHGRRALRYLKEIGSTEDNLKESFESETKVAGHAYGDFIKYASEIEDKAALTILTQTRDVEEVHAKLYKEAMNHMLEDTDTTYYVCSVCGYVSDGVLPEVCPVCGVPKEKFTEFR
ncbi:MAG: rubrerythrin family protein [Deltaproteobacteria bacterium]|uniref:Rubrerythrin family protein n=1 Tax=Candidatus Zymogenus saltonus TaxID=2844893 RepID=A0A9D8KCY0_9DELT|nr:rubrerythrin family protein [Candidatus Zymogenus saltonus]